MKVEISRFFFKQKCVDNNEKMVKINEKENPEIYQIFVKMKMETKISTKKFYKKFRKIFVKEVPVKDNINNNSKNHN